MVDQTGSQVNRFQIRIYKTLPETNTAIVGKDVRSRLAGHDDRST